MEKKTYKVGPITLAIALIVSGLALLGYNFGLIANLSGLWKLWPLLLVGVGAEYFVRRMLAGDAGENEVRFHVGSLVLLILLLMAGGVAYTVATVSKDFGGILNVIPWEDSALAYKRSWAAEPIPLKAGELLFIENKVGQVKLSSAPGNELKVNAVIRSSDHGPARELADSINPEIKREGDRVLIQMPETQNWSERMLAVDLEVAVPVGVKVNVDSGTGRVFAENMEQDLVLVANTGTIEAENLRGKVEIRNNTGRIQVVDPGGDLIAETNTGSIEVSSTRPLSGKYQLISSTGRITLELPRESDLSITAESRTGNVDLEGLPENSERDGMGSRYTNKLGAGKGSAELRVGTGSISITAR